MEIFGIGPIELTLILVIAFIVLGPDRLPVVAHRLGVWLAQLRRQTSKYLNQVKEELGSDQLELEAIQNELLSVRNELQAARDEFKTATRELSGQIDASMRDAATELQSTASTQPEAPPDQPPIAHVPTQTTQEPEPAKTEQASPASPEQLRLELIAATQELHAARDELQVTRDELRAARDELRAARDETVGTVREQPLRNDDSPSGQEHP
ncbi:MAG: twin-arginine translocase TatA/TatE family subunit [Thermoflexales bacterium]|nr:twin-arginine translocase TatA/TatE family subunit [Thermoflexales bacterium]